MKNGWSIGQKNTFMRFKSRRFNDIEKAFELAEALANTRTLSPQVQDELLKNLREVAEEQQPYLVSLYF